MPTNTGVYFWSDLHFGHEKVARARGFSNAEEMNTYLISKLFAVAGRKNIIWLLGDIWDVQPLTQLMELCRRESRGLQLRIVMGNHDPDSEVVWNILAGATPLSHFYGFKLYGVKEKYGFWLTHMPVHPNDIITPGRQGIRGNIHGHIHMGTTQQQPSMPQYYNVNVDYHPNGPVSLDTIRQYFDQLDVLAELPMGAAV